MMMLRGAESDHIVTFGGKSFAIGSVQQWDGDSVHVQTTQTGAERGHVHGQRDI